MGNDLIPEAYNPATMDTEKVPQCSDAFESCGSTTLRFETDGQVSYLAATDINLEIGAKFVQEGNDMTKVADAPIAPGASEAADLVNNSEIVLKT